MNNRNLLDYSANLLYFYQLAHKKKTIPEEIVLYFDLYQLLKFRSCSN